MSLFHHHGRYIKDGKEALFNSSGRHSRDNKVAGNDPSFYAKVSSTVIGLKLIRSHTPDPGFFVSTVPADEQKKFVKRIRQKISFFATRCRSFRSIDSTTNQQKNSVGQPATQGRHMHFSVVSGGLWPPVGDCAQGRHMHFFIAIKAVPTALRLWLCGKVTLLGNAGD